MTLVLTELPEAVQEAVARTRERVAALHAELPRNGLVVWTAGNVSERVPRPSAGAPSDGAPSTDPADAPELFVIKPSGVSYDDLSPESMVVCTLDGEKIADGTPESLSPSSDTAAHAYVYRHMDKVGGVVHTHSTYATAWAARGEEIPCVLTMMADEFGGPIPVGPLAVIGDDSIGQGIVETLGTSRSRAVLMRNHGPFTIGQDARDAVKAAVMCEEVARTVHISRQLGEPLAVPETLVDSLFDRYQNVYGQR
ncbi:L-ribulose-5-phosphate 4-epimerase [Brachybacterium kimchii]|uniref:L-ribulose-5-phosphate 4-epimerase n=1 Tax=Brachybacterium kimchii TaxID=2942909 RepID=A0ABY4N6D5_9MICO|nr:L-ribulose-5-phosphate 4-epimerase [Brachybacterium kimchii]UQN29003.1 L-ribulose-5-phosphate 4-epimerase [Brachybacterium kimchii]